MGLLDNFSFEKAKTNLLGTTPAEQSRALSSISAALRRSTRPGESAFGNVSQAILGGRSERDIATKNSSLEVKKAARDRANDFLALMPNGKNLTDLSQEDQLKVKTYIESEGGDYSSLFNLDWKEGALPDAPKTVTGYDEVTGQPMTFQWNAKDKDWTTIGGAKISSESKDALSSYGTIALDMGLTKGTAEFTEKVQQLWNEAHAKATGTGPQGTNADGSTGGGVDSSKLQELNDRRVVLDQKLADELITPEQHAMAVAINRKALAGYTDPLISEYAKDQVSNFSKISDQQIDDGAASAKILKDSYEIANILKDPNLYVGTWGEAVAIGNRFLVTMGMAPVDANAGAELLRSKSMEAILNYVQDTKGSISDKEMQQFKEAAVGLSKTREGNKLIIEHAAKAANFKQAEHDEFFRWNAELEGRREVPSVSKWKTHQKKWAKDNKFTVPTLAEIQTALKGTLLTNTGSGGGSASTPLPPTAVSRGVTQAMWDTYPQATKDLYTK